MTAKNLPDLGIRRLVAASAFSATLMLLLVIWSFFADYQSQRDRTTGLYGTMPLVMKGGDPYIRALMRTISASESNYAQPYSVIYGGEYVKNLQHHPSKCIKIVSGPNKGNCSTAAGRYQMLNTTWIRKAKRYHPKPSRFIIWTSYSFEPEYQDAVVYAWLKDQKAWGVDISKMLRDGKLEAVLRLLSGTWTSLGYGIETNSMSKNLPRIYQRILKEELKAST